MNPELQRNLWLELSVHRLLATPAIIALVSVLIVMNGEGHGYTVLATVAGYAGLALVAWGSKLAADGIGDEARGRTWDAQRLTSIGPWQMTYGKLVGATVFAWYGGAICIALFVLTGMGWLDAPVLKLAGLVVAAAVLCHAVAFNATLMSAQRNPGTRTSSGLLWVLVLLIAIGPLRGLLTVDDRTLAWWGETYAVMTFVLASAVVFAAWAVFGAYRNMCSALHVPTLPWALVAFLGFVSVYVAGFPMELIGSAAGLVAVVGVGVSLLACYALLFMEQTGAMTLRRLQMRLSRRQWRQALEELPGWPVALLVALLFALGTELTSVQDGGQRRMAGTSFALWLFAVRDAALMHFFAFARQPRRVVATTVFYLVLLYVVLPWLLWALHVNALAIVLWPFSSAQPTPNTAAIAMQAVIALFLAAWRWRRMVAAD